MSDPLRNVARERLAILKGLRHSAAAPSPLYAIAPRMEVPLEDEALVKSFEAGVAPPDGFHHREHVRVAWWYLRSRALPEALATFSAGLRRFAAANGTPDLYHETITTAYVLLINERLDGAARSLPWDAFAGHHPDLLMWKPSVLDRYYHPDTLTSERARRTFVLPDRLAAEEIPRDPRPDARDVDAQRARTPGAVRSR